LAKKRNEERNPAASSVAVYPKGMKTLRSSKRLLARFKDEIEFYRLVLHHPRTPKVSRVLLGTAIAYALSPIDLIPDFVPVIGHLDDLLILPVLVWSAKRLIPEQVIQECRMQVRSIRMANQAL
jgi:uncharacterized membrane protein YkvA (DUF1232 family)